MAERENPFPLDVVVALAADAALRGMMDREYLASQNWQTQQMRPNRRGAHPDIVEFSRCYIKGVAKLGIPLYPHNMVRTPEQQRQLWLDGFSKNDGSKWYPHRAFAVDVVHSTRHWNLSDADWELLVHVGNEVAKAKGIHVVNGSTFKRLWDPAHWELKEWRDWYLRAPFADDQSVAWVKPYRENAPRRG